MSIELRLPNINASDANGQLAQMKTYMYQLVEQLNWALSTVNSASEGGYNVVSYTTSGEAVKAPTTSRETFDALKDAIIKSATVVDSIYDSISQRLSSKYVAISDFGTYTEEKLGELEMSPDYIKQIYSAVEQIGGIVKSNNGYIKTGKLDTGDYGVEVGVTEGDRFNRYARFVPDGIYFYTPNGSEAVAKLTNNELVVTNAQFTGNVGFGGYVVDTHNGVTWRWKGVGA